MSWSAIATLLFLVGVVCSTPLQTPATGITSQIFIKVVFVIFFFFFSSSSYRLNLLYFAELLPPREDNARSEFNPATDLIPPKIDDESSSLLPTLATDLLPPSIDSTSVYEATGELLDANDDDTSSRTPSTDLLPPHDATPATDLVPPPFIPDDKKIPATLFLINVFAVKNQSAENTNDVLSGDVMKEVPDDVAGT